jgi:hypothetical protein
LIFVFLLAFIHWPGDASNGPQQRTGRETDKLPLTKNSLAVNPTNSDVIYLATETGAIYKTETGGQQWEAINEGLPGTFYRRTYPPLLAVNPGPPEVVYALIGYPVHSGLIENRLYRRVEGDQTWQEIKRLAENQIFTSLTINPENPGELICESEHGTVRIEDHVELTAERTDSSRYYEQVVGSADFSRFDAQQQDRDEGNIAVLHDDGTFLRVFDLANRAIEFTPSGSGYTVSSISASLDTTPGTRQTLGDNASVPMSLPFSFPFYGTSRASLFINSNGNLTFNTSNTDETPTTAEFVSGPPRIAPLWNDLNPAATSNPNGVFFRSATGPSRVIITWNAVPEFNATDANTFQVVLFSDGRIRFVYGAMAVREALTGISNGPASTFTQVNFSQDLPASFGFNPVLELFNRELDRRAVARRFSNSHPDNFDFLAIFGSSTFTNSLTGPGQLAFAELVKNQITGIGLSTFDNSSGFGSAGRLQAIGVMNRLSDFPNDPNERIGRTTSSTLDVLARIIGFRWGAYVRFSDGGIPSDALLDAGRSNWSFFHDTDASLFGGNEWRDNGGGSFTSTEATTRFSPLDQYLMGLRAAGEVPDFFFISNPTNTGGRDRNSSPEIGVTLNGTRRTVSINNVLAIEGPRNPAFGAAPTSFTQAFILIVPPGEEASQADLNKIERLRQTWTNAFQTATNNRGTVQTTLAAPAADLVVEGLTANPTNVTPGGTVTLNFTIANRGGVQANPTNHEIRLSSDPVIDTSDRLLVIVGTASLAPNGSFPFTNLNVTIPFDVASGTQFIGVIADAFNANAEANETNNTAASQITVSSPQPDLVVTNLTVNPTTAAPGATVTVSFTIFNQGQSTAGPANHEIRLSLDSTINSADTLLVIVGTPSLAGGGSHPLTVNVTVLFGTPSGTRFMGVIVDSGNLVAEANEGNNTGSAPITIQ